MFFRHKQYILSNFFVRNVIYFYFVLINRKICYLKPTSFVRMKRVMRRHADKVDCVTFWNLSDRDFK